MRPIIDAHLDLAWNALSWNRDLTQSVAEIRAAEAAMTDTPARGRNTVALPDMRRGNVAVSVATILARAKPVRPREGFKRTDLDYATQEITSAIGQGQLAYYRQLQQRGDIRLITDSAALDAHFAAWREHADSLPLGIILSMEGADPIVEPGETQWWFDHGLRACGLAHYGQGHYAMGTGEEGPLTAKGMAILKEFSRLGIVLDLTHCSEPGFSQALDQFDGSILASHNNCRTLVPGDRQFSDEQIKRLIARGAVIGAAFDSWMLYPNWKRGQTPREAVTLAEVANHIDHVCQIAGNANHAAIGSDLDGGFGTEQSPGDIETIADIQKLDEILSRRGYSAGDIDTVFFRNWLNFFKAALPKSHG